MGRPIALCLLAVLSLAGCTSGGSGPSDAVADHGPASGALSTTAPVLNIGCSTNYSSRRLPTWARAGFDPPTQPMPYVIGDSGDIAAIVWGSHHPLVVPPAADRNNKILWVARVGAADGPLKIQAQLVRTGQTVNRMVTGAPGPSIIDLPSPGCWSFDLTWGDHHDHLRLGYASS